MSAPVSIGEFLRGQPVIVLFLLLGLGQIVGRMRLGEFALGPIAGTLIVGLLFSGFGFRISSGAQAVGFALYIFAVGYQAGPRFFGVLREHGLKYLALVLFVCGIGCLTTWIAGRVLELPPGASAGLLSGAMTASSTLAAAEETLRSGHVALPAGITPDQAIAALGATYAITYLVGTLGVLFVVTLGPKILGFNLEAEARRLESAPDAGVEPLQARAYRVENPEFCDVPIRDLAQRYWDGLAVVRIRRDLDWLSPGVDERLRTGDEIYAYGYANFFRGGIDRAGPEIRILGELELAASLTHVLVARKGAVGKTLRALDLARQYGLVVCEVKRDGIALPVSRDLVLNKTDILTVVGPVWGIRALPDILGPVERDVVETDMTTFAFGIAAGAAVGVLSVTVGGIPISLGSASGLLVLGILTGWLNSTRLSVGALPGAARWILMEFGLLIFIAAVGLNSGAGIADTLMRSGVGLIVAATCVVVLPLALGYWFGARVLKLEPVILLGALTGAMTSGPALTVLTRESRSSVPALGYTGTYALAGILLTIAGTLLARW